MYIKSRLLSTDEFLSDGANMSKKEPKKNLVGPWRAVHVAIWLVGIAFLAINDWWWPGILVLVAISGLFEAFLRRYVPKSYEEETPTISDSPAVAVPEPVTPVAATSASATPAVQEHRLEFLPQVCPSCNGPIRGHEVKWTGPQSANCPYCGTNLPMNKA
jgi:hypothetical protein